MVKQQVGIQKENVGGRESCPFEKVRILRHSQEDRGWEGHLLELGRMGWGGGCFSFQAPSPFILGSLLADSQCHLYLQPQLLLSSGTSVALGTEIQASGSKPFAPGRTLTLSFPSLNFPHFCLCVTQTALKDMCDDDGGAETPQRESEPVVPPASNNGISSHLSLSD